MKAESWNKIKNIVDELLQLPADQRLSAAEDLCAPDSELLNDVVDFLLSVDKSDHFFDNFSRSKSQFLKLIKADLLNESDETRFIGNVLNNYKIISHIETGGMGTVYLAERCDGTFNKKAAIKILKREFVIPGLKERFKQEMQILANLTHPGIAKVYDSALYEGLPYFIMEYVEGKTILEYCNQNRCTIKERVDLFTEVLKIVDFAHSNLVVHRDLKPENILVDEFGMVKILDFGISKLEKHTAVEAGEHSSPDFLTPKYAAPEQFSSGPDSTLTDIYSLGILLNDLLSGTTLVSTDNKSIEEIKKEKISGIRKKPSDHFKSLSPDERTALCRQRKIKPKQLFSLLKNDFDYIILKATDHRQNSRYASAGLLIADLKKFIRTKPISARKPSPGYVAGKFVLRNRRIIGTAALTLLLLVITAFYTTSEIKNEKRTALAEKEHANEVTLFLMDLFDASSPISTNGDTLSAASILNLGMNRIETVNNLETRVKLLGVMGNAFIKLSEFENARVVLSQAADESSIAFGPNHLYTADIFYKIGSLYTKDYTWQNAVPNLKQAYAIYSGQLPDDDLRIISSLSKLGRSYGSLGQRDSSFYYSEKAYSTIKNNINPELSLDVMEDYAIHLSYQNRIDEAESVYFQMEDYIAKNFGDDDYRLISIYNRLGLLYRNQDLFEQAETYYKKALTISEELYGFDHLSTTRIRSNLAPTLVFLDKANEAEKLLFKNLEAFQARFTENHWRTGAAYGAIANFLAGGKRYSDSRDYFELMLINFQQTIGYEHSWTSYAEGALAAVNRHLGNHQLADSLYRKNVQFLKNIHPDFTPDNRNQIRRIINIYSADSENYQNELSTYHAFLDDETSDSSDD